MGLLAIGLVKEMVKRVGVESEDGAVEKVESFEGSGKRRLALMVVRVKEE